MDKIENYKKIILAFLEEYAQFKPVNLTEVENQVIVDKEEKHFQLVSMGWSGLRFIYEVLFHFDIRDGKIWIQRNQTEALVGDELVLKGVDRNDIVLGFNPPISRPHSGFAAA
jgi:hypothetical protein